MPHVLVIWCWCGHMGEVPVPHLAGFDRSAILQRVRCSRCGARRVAETRLVYTAGVNPFASGDD